MWKPACKASASLSVLHLFLIKYQTFEMMVRKNRQLKKVWVTREDPLIFFTRVPSLIVFTLQSWMKSTEDTLKCTDMLILSLRCSLTYKHNWQLSCFAASADTLLRLHLPNGALHGSVWHSAATIPTTLIKQQIQGSHTHTLCLSAAGSKGLYALYVKFISMWQIQWHSSSNKFSSILFSSGHFNAFRAILRNEPQNVFLWLESAQQEAFWSQGKMHFNLRQGPLLNHMCT